MYRNAHINRARFVPMLTIIIIIIGCPACVSIRFYIFIFATDGLISCYSYRVYGMRNERVYT